MASNVAAHGFIWQALHPWYCRSDFSIVKHSESVKSELKPSNIIKSCPQFVCPVCCPSAALRFRTRLVQEQSGLHRTSVLSNFVSPDISCTTLNGAEGYLDVVSTFYRACCSVHSDVVIANFACPCLCGSPLEERPAPAGSIPLHQASGKESTRFKRKDKKYIGR